MKFCELTIMPEDKNRHIKIVYENDEYETRVDDCTITFSKKLTPEETRCFLEDMFGTTSLGVYDVSHMSDEEIKQIIDDNSNIYLLKEGQVCINTKQKF